MIMKKILVKISFILFLVLAMADMQKVDASAKVKTKKITINLRGGNTAIREPVMVLKAKKVKVKSSKKSVVMVKFKKKKKEIYFKAKKKGTASICVTCKMKNGKTEKLRYKVKVIKTKAVTDLDRSKKAFAIQNQYRKENGVKELEWSDELYQFCLYRIKTSGFDSHSNLGRDMNDYFGDYAGYKDMYFGENMATSSDQAKDVMLQWKKSSGHYRNMLDADHTCGAIAFYHGMWLAIFYNGEISDFENWRSYQIKKISVKRYDSVAGTYLKDCRFAYYESDDKENSLVVGKIIDELGEDVYLEIGKTYVFYERIAPDGYAKAERVTVTVTSDGPNEVILSN